MAAPSQNTTTVTDFERFLVDHGFLTKEAFENFQTAKRVPGDKQDSKSPGEVDSVKAIEELYLRQRVG